MIRARLVDLRGLPPPEEALLRLPDAPGLSLLDSALEGHALCRSSFLGCDPVLVLEARGRRVRVLRPGRAPRALAVHPLDALERLLSRFAGIRAEEAGPASGAAVGFLSYDLGRLLERIPARARRDLPFPDLRISFHDHGLLWDVRRRSWRGFFLEGRGARPDARERVRALVRRIGRPAAAAVPARAGRVQPALSRASYLRAVRRILAYIAAGDAYQVNYAQRFEAGAAGDPRSLYRALRARSPAPFAAYLRLPAGAVLSVSPERFLSVAGDRVETRPIKGTAPRGRAPREDRGNARRLAASAKDRAELRMIVDLERNDLGRVCRYGSVRVRTEGEVEAHPTVFHRVAVVEGRLRPDATRAGLLRATFPGGSITGAPKIRAMEIIEELEPSRRSVYCGAIGAWWLDGGLDLSIAIRTALWAPGRLWYSAGGGIVADSDPGAEYRETLDKARAFLDAVDSLAT